MAEITVNLTDDLKHFVDGQVDGGGYGNASEYIGKLLIRVKKFPNHLAFYFARENEIEVVRVLHGSRDLNAALDA